MKSAIRNPQSAILRTPLYSLEQQMGARFTGFHGWEIPEHYGSVESEYRYLRHSAGVIELCYRGKLAVTGDDRTAYLHRMLSNDVKSLRAGEGAYCFLLDPQGHIQADMNLLVEPNRILIDTEPSALEKLHAQLERFIIMDQVEIAAVSADLGTIAVEGPLAREIVDSVVGVELPHMKPLDHLSPKGAPDALLARISLTGEGFWLIAPVDRCPQLWQKLNERAVACGGGPAGLAAREIVRIEAGVPRLGQDILENTIPQETGQFRALSFTKGCYPGQEIVERVRSRGHVSRKLVGLAVTGEKSLHVHLEASSKLQAGGREVGQLTSAVYSPGLGRSIALGYVRREFAAPGTRLETDGAQVEVRPLPP